eukprot:7681040-Lingulodinium_polyedra.AAC.1
MGLEFILKSLRPGFRSRRGWVSGTPWPRKICAWHGGSHGAGWLRRPPALLLWHGRELWAP